MTLFVTLLAAFVVSHIVLANPPVRDALVRRLGENGFRIGYAIVSLALLFGTIQAYRAVPPGPLLWVAPAGAWHVSTLVMLFAAILFVGSLTPANRALAGVPLSEKPAKGVLAITRHPMMWAFGLWAAVHVLLSGMLDTVLLAGGIGFLALVGAAAQDGKKRAQLGDNWRGWEAQTSYWPFGAQITGKQPWTSLWVGVVPLAGGLVLWLLLTWLHPSLMRAPSVPPWQWAIP
ncbi:MAG: NnrU family protein [Thermaurantiacus sp.]